MVPLILGHIALAIYVSRAGFSASEILGRTEGSRLWTLYYCVLVLAVTVHGPIGFYNVLSTWTGWRGWSLKLSAIALACALLTVGLRAVYTVTVH